MSENNAPKVIIDLYPGWLTALIREVQLHHAPLIEYYSLAGEDYPEVLACLAREVSIFVDDDAMTPNSQEMLANAIRVKLEARHTPILLSRPPVLVPAPKKQEKQDS